MIVRIGLRLFYGLLLALCMMALSVPLMLAVPLAALTLALLWRPQAQRTLTRLAISSTVFVVFAEAVLRDVGTEPDSYRPHDILLGQDIPYYRANQTITDFTIPRGDIGTLWPDMPGDVHISRKVRFSTDGLGFRNDADYSGQPYVAVGDSFVVGNGTDQDDTLPRVLTHTYGLPTYGAGFPSGLDAYSRMFSDAVEARSDTAGAIVLIFEGNDLLCPADLERFRPDRQWWNYVPGEIRSLEVYRLSSGFTRRILARLLPETVATGFVRPVGDRPMAFYAPYAAVARATSGKDCDWDAALGSLDEIADRIALLVFVPTKYRVYAPLIDGELDGPLPHPRRDAVAAYARDKELGFLDLTPTLTAAAAAGLGSGEDAYWRDDTHWAPAGIHAAAGAIAQALEPAMGPKP
ncbi:MAG: hypothetical protein QNJ92_03740 [Alphaproteobacteria bacterium]|nr:hypothetical protein [Alphaproteobacteria bacterium]